MISVFDSWYKRKFSDPDAVMLLLLLVAVFLFFIFWGKMLTPVIVSMALAYLLDWPVSKMEKMNLSRTASSSLVTIMFISVMVLFSVGLLPVVWNQSINLINEAPQIWSKTQQWLVALPEYYPNLVKGGQIEKMLEGVDDKIVGIGQGIISASFSSIFGVGAFLIYAILVPLMMFFMLKDKPLLLKHVSSCLPKQRRLILQVGQEMNGQIINYIRGKVIEILIVGTISVITFLIFDIRYALLLGILVGFSVLIPYIGAAVVTIPIAAVALFQWGVSPEFWYIMIAYAIIQALDGNLLVPILFSEAVNLHPLYIIIAVLFFGGLWGFWGVFFAIPLATLVNALFRAWSTPIADKVTEAESL